MRREGQTGAYFGDRLVIDPCLAKSEVKRKIVADLPNCSRQNRERFRRIVTSMNVWANLRLVRQMLSKKPKIRAKHLIRDDDLSWVRVTSATPVACQIDGDYLGLRDDMTFRAVPEALGVVAPPAKTR